MRRYSIILISLLIVSCGSEDAMIKGKMDCWTGTGSFFLKTGYGSNGMELDTIAVKGDGTFVWRGKLEKDTIYSLYTDFMGGEEKQMYDIIVSPGKTVTVDIRTSRDKGWLDTDIRYSGANAMENTFLKMKSDFYCPEYTKTNAAKVSFAEFRGKVNAHLAAARKAYYRCDTSRLKYAKDEIEGAAKRVLFNYPWGLQVEGKPLDSDKDFNTFADSIDYNIFSNLYAVNQLMRWHVACDTTAEEPLVRFMQIAGEKIKDEEMRNTVTGYAVMESLSRGGSSHMDRVFDALAEVNSNKAHQENLKAQYQQMNKFKAGSPAIDFELQDKGGKKVRFVSLLGKGKVTVVDFWATWCRSCCEEIPFVEKLTKEFPDIEFISVSLDTKADVWLARLEKYGSQWPQYIIPEAFDSEFAKEYNVLSIPRFMVFDKEGNIVDLAAPKPSTEAMGNLLRRL